MRQRAEGRRRTTDDRTRFSVIRPLASLLFVTGCAGDQSALDPAGVQAARIDRLWWIYFAVCVAVYVLVMAAVVYAAVRKRERSVAPGPPTIEPPAAAERRLTVTVTGAVAVTVVTLFVLLIGDFATGRGLHAQADEHSLKVLVTGHQWWWEVRYQDPTPSNIVTTANELHLPLGKTVLVELQSTDVIHSFWVPNLHGKTDMIPGHPTRTAIRGDRPGMYWGQCAEFCGYQHANMRLPVTVEPEEQFYHWLDAGRQSAADPTTDAQKHGREVFLGGTCVMCHTIQGTVAHATVGPDLTHVGGRPWVGAGTVPNTRGHLAGWVADPQRVKPGVRMPPNPLRPEDLRALLDYLESLK